MSSWLANCGDAGRLCSSHAREAMSRIARKSSARRFVSELRKLDFCLLQRYMEHNRHSLDRIQCCFCRSLKRSDPRNRGATSLWSLSPCSRSVKPTRAARCPCAPPTAKSSVLRQRCSLGSDSTAWPMVARTAAPCREVSLATALCLHRHRCSRTATRSPTPPQWTVASLEAALASKDVQIVARQPHSTMPPRSREAYLAVARGPSSRTRLVAAPR